MKKARQGQSSAVEIALSAVKANPFRQLEKFPLDQARVAVLRKSIQRTDFWENVVARKRGEFYELAYGHHRLEALRQEFGAKAKVRLLVRELDDETMLKMMAADNDDAYNLSPGFILETVEAARGFIKKSPVTRTGKHEGMEGPLARFLAWPVERVKHALAQLGAIERNELSREAVKKLSKQREAIALHSEVQKAKKRGEPIPLDKQEKLVARAVKREKARAEVAIKDEVAVEMHPAPTAIEQKTIEFTQYLSKAIDKLTTAEAVLRELLEFKSDLTGEIYGRTLKTTRILYVCEAMERHLKQLFGGERNHENKHETTDPAGPNHRALIC